MVRRLILVAVALALALAAGASRASDGRASAVQCDPTEQGCFELVSTIAFSSTRDHVSEVLTLPLLGAEVYLAEVMNQDTPAATVTNLRRLTDNAYLDAFANLSPDGKKIVFDSDRLTAGAVCDGPKYYNIDDLFVMSTDGTEQTLLTRGSSTTWSPDSKNIAFHASASYYASGGVLTGCPIRSDPGSATSDSDIFAANVDDLLAGRGKPRNITNSSGMIDDDPDWSPDGQQIVFTSHPVTDLLNPSNQTELYVMNPDGTGLQQLTHNGEEERAPAWSPDGTRIVYSARVGGGTNPFRIFVMNADGGDVQQLTNERDVISDLTATWSPDGQQILYHRRGVVAPGDPTPDGQQLFIMKPDGSAQTQLTYPPGVNNLAHWGELRVKS